MSHCRGLSIGQWSPIYSALFQLLLARLLVTNIRQLFELSMRYRQLFSHFMLIYIHSK